MIKKRLFNFIISFKLVIDRNIIDIVFLIIVLLKMELFGDCYLGLGLIFKEFIKFIGYLFIMDVKNFN